MAKFIATAVSAIAPVREFINKGPQATMHAVVQGLPEQFLTKMVGTKVLSGVGEINPLMMIAGKIVSKLRSEVTSRVILPAIGASAKVRVVSTTKGTSADENSEALVEGTPRPSEVFTAKSVKVDNLNSRLDTPGLDETREGEIYKPGKFFTPAGSAGSKDSSLRNVKDTNADPDAGLLDVSFPKNTAGKGESFSVVDSNVQRTLYSSNIIASVQDTQGQDEARKSKELFRQGVFSGTRKEGSILGPGSAKTPPLAPPGIRWKGNNIIHPGVVPILAAQWARKSAGGQESFDLPGKSKDKSKSGGSRIGASVRKGFQDLIQAHRFLVVDATNDGRSVFEWSEGEEPTSLAAGFESCDAPYLKITTEEIKEGTWEFPRTIPTGVEAGSITMTKGFVQGETGFYIWIMNALRGLMTRRTLQIISYGRSKERGGQPWSKAAQLRGNSMAVWTLHNCIPIGYKPGQQWNATTAAVQIAELEIAYEWFEEAVKTT